MHHTCVYYLTDSGVSTNRAIPAVTDQWATISTNGNFIFPKELELFACYPFADTITSCTLNAPHWRFVNQPAITPVLISWGSTFLITAPYFDPKRITIPRIDEVQALVSTSAQSTTGIQVSLHAFDKAHTFNLPPGDVYPCRFTSQITGATGAWTYGNISFEQSLPAGRYAVVGMEVRATVVTLARLRFQEYTMMPGCTVWSGAFASNRDIWRYGQLGVWGEFENTAVPTLGIFQGLGTPPTSVTGVIDLIKIR